MPLSDGSDASACRSRWCPATVVLLWHGIEAVFDALLSTGLVILALGLLALAVAMRNAPEYGRSMASSTFALGAAGLAAAGAVLVGVPDVAAVGVFALIALHLTLGWKTLKLARAPHSGTGAGA